MNETLTFLSCALATYRLSVMLVAEAGPFDMMFYLRRLFGIKHDRFKIPVGIPDSFPGALFGCVWCMSVWVGMAFSFFFLLNPEFAFYLSMPFAYSAVAIVLDGLQVVP